MSRRLILLAGLHKTGTTSLQRNCAAQAELLARAGLFYPPDLDSSGRFVSGGNGNHGQLFRACFKTGGVFWDGNAGGEVGRDEHARQTALLRQALRELLENQGSRQILMSAEGVSTMSLAELGDLKAWFNGQDIEVDLVCVVRRLSSWLNSMVAQKVAGRRGPRLTLDLALQGFSGGLVQPRIETLRTVFPEARFFSFEVVSAQSGGLNRFLFELLDMEASRSFEAIRTNEATSHHGTGLHSMINTVIGSRYKDPATDLRYARLYETHQRLWSIPGVKFRCQASAVAPLMERIHTENRWLREQFGSDFFDADLQFEPAPVPLDTATRNYLRECAALSAPRIAAVIQAYLASQPGSGG